MYTGLLLAADNEAELAGVLAHEAGHVVGRHSARAMVNAYGLQAITQVALGKNPGPAAQIAAQLAGGGRELAHGRSEETEADEYGAKYARGRTTIRAASSPSSRSSRRCRAPRRACSSG